MLAGVESVMDMINLILGKQMRYFVSILQFYLSMGYFMQIIVPKSLQALSWLSFKVCY